MNECKMSINAASVNAPRPCKKKKRIAVVRACCDARLVISAIAQNLLFDVTNTCNHRKMLLRDRHMLSRQIDTSRSVFEKNCRFYRIIKYIKNVLKRYLKKTIFLPR